MILRDDQNPQQQAQQKILAAVEIIPAFPKSVQEVLRLAQEVNCLPRDLVQVIQHDPVFTLKILKVVNSPFIGLLRPITSIQQASVYLGLNTMKNLALSLAAVGALRTTVNLNFSWQKFWWHSLSVAIISKQLAALLNIPTDEQAEFFSAGLLHDIGKVIFALYMPDEFTLARKNAMDCKTMLHEAETDVLGLNHADVGGLLATKWQFPASLASGIADHHKPNEQMNPLAVCVFTANQISKIKALGFAGESKVETTPAFITKHFKMEIHDIIAHLGNVEEELANAKVFISG